MHIKTELNKKDINEITDKTKGLRITLTIDPCSRRLHTKTHQAPSTAQHVLHLLSQCSLTKWIHFSSCIIIHIVNIYKEPVPDTHDTISGMCVSLSLLSYYFVYLLFLLFVFCLNCFLPSFLFFTFLFIISAHYHIMFFVLCQCIHCSCLLSVCPSSVFVWLAVLYKLLFT